MYNGCDELLLEGIYIVDWLWLTSVRVYKASLCVHVGCSGGSVIISMAEYLQGMHKQSRGKTASQANALYIAT